jgi:hypothetical protein
MGKKLNINDLSVAQAKLSDAQVSKTIKEGIQTDGKLRMKPIKDLSEDDIKAVTKFLRTLK